MSIVILMKKIHLDILGAYVLLMKNWKTNLNNSSSQVKTGFQHHQQVLEETISLPVPIQATEQTLPCHL
jgi:hypothetical protein